MLRLILKIDGFSKIDYIYRTIHFILLKKGGEEKEKEVKIKDKNNE